MPVVARSGYFLEALVGKTLCRVFALSYENSIKRIRHRRVVIRSMRADMMQGLRKGILSLLGANVVTAVLAYEVSLKLDKVGFSSSILKATKRQATEALGTAVRELDREMELMVHGTVRSGQ